MFPTFEIPPQHAETVGARKARRAKAEETARRSSSATSQSSESIQSANANSSKSRSGEKSGFGGWFGKSSKKGVQEISALPSLKRGQFSKEPEPEIHEIEPCPPTAPLPPPQQDGRRPSNRSDYDHQIPSPDQFPPPPLRSLPSLPPSSALPVPPSLGLLSLPGMCSVCSSYDLQKTWPTRFARDQRDQQSPCT